MKTPTSAPRAEQIQNGDFSNGSQSWLIYDDINFDNARCNVGPGGVATQVLSNIPAGRYRLSCLAARTSAGNPTARLRLRINSTNVQIDITSSTPQTYNNDVDIPANSEAEIYIEANAAAAWFDDVSLNLAPVNDELIQNGDFSEGSAHWDMTGADFEQATCKLGINQVTQTVPVPVIGYYQLTARARAGSGSMGRLQIRGVPDGETQYKPVNSTEWTEYVIDIGAIQGETHFKVELGRVMSDDVEFDDVSLRLVSGVAK
ncbi:MAG TPA: hypothetical protein DIT18_00720 [Pseudomonas sp.]|nr:hypothetical protein [Pseudomonas sp.]